MSVRSKVLVESEGELTNPADDALVADTGAALKDGIYEVWVTVGSSAAAHFALQNRNAANSANQQDPMGIYTPAGQSGTYYARFVCVDGGRIRLVTDDALTGTAWGTIVAQKML